MKIAIVTGAFGFAGANLVECLIASGYKVYAVGRPDSAHNTRFKESAELKPVFADMNEYDRLSAYIDEADFAEGDFFFYHLAWGGDRGDYEVQRGNIDGALRLMDTASAIKERARSVRFVGIGSQAEYGLQSDEHEITEDIPLEPVTAYGSCKAAAFYLLKGKAACLGIPFVWGRIFSLIGKYEPQGRMFSDLVVKLRRGESMNLSSCEQYWDYLDAADAAEAIRALGERGSDGEAYNIAGGSGIRLKDYVLEAADIIGADRELLHFGDRAEPFVSLRPSAQKIKADTMWEARLTLAESIEKY